MADLHDAARDVGGGFVVDPDHSICLRLAPLSAAAASDLARVATVEAPISPHEMAALTDRAGGNPLFLKELLASIDARDGLDALPDSVEALMTARIDRLAPDDRALLRRVSVLGRRFPVSLLPAVLEEVPASHDPVWERVSDFLHADGDEDLTFEHALVRDAAYEGLSYRLRRALHAGAGDAIARSALERVDDYAELLSLHYLHAQRHADAWKYALVAAERARAVYANIEAAEFYERAIDAGRNLPSVDRRELLEIHERLGEVRERAGVYARAEAAYRVARKLVSDDAVIDARLLLRLARLQGLMDRYSRGLRWITRGLRRLEGTDSEDGDRQRAQLLAAYAQFSVDAGKAKQALTWCRLAIDAAETAGNLEAEAQARKVHDWALMDLGLLETPTDFMRSLALYEELDDLRGQSVVLNNLGVFAYWKGRWNEAVDLWQRSREVVERTGDGVTRALITLNTAEIQLDQGRVDEAQALLGEALRVSQAAGHRSGVVLAKIDLGRAAYLSGRFEDGIRWIEEAATEARELGAQSLALEASARRAECRLLSGDAAVARSLAEELLDKARSLPGAGALSPLLHRVRGVASLRLGDDQSAVGALQESLAAARVRDAPFDVALSLLALAGLDAVENLPSREDLLAESQEILDGLGVEPAAYMQWGSVAST